MVISRMGASLHQHGHGHGGHGHSHGGGGGHGHSHGGGSSEPNVNVRAAFIHVLGDFLQSMGVLVAAIVIYLKVLNFSLVLLYYTHI